MLVYLVQQIVLPYGRNTLASTRFARTPSIPGDNGGHQRPAHAPDEAVSAHRLEQKKKQLEMEQGQKQKGHEAREAVHSPLLGSWSLAERSRPLDDSHGGGLSLSVASPTGRHTLVLLL